MPPQPTTFDPYHKWLGIAPKDQPPHHYRLLGIEPFESDVDVIDSAANQRMAFLAGHVQGSFASRAAELVSQVAAARACLLDPQSRALYDAQLRQRQGKPRPQPAGRVPSAAWRDSPAARPVPIPVATALEPEAELAAPSFDPFAGSPSSTARKSQIRRKAAQRQFRIGLVGQILAPVVGLAIGYWIISSIDPQFDFLHLRGNPDVAERPPGTGPPTDRPQESPKPRPSMQPSAGQKLAGGRASVGANGQSKVAVDASKQSGSASTPAAAPVEQVNPFLKLPAEVVLPPLIDGVPAVPAALVEVELVPNADFDLFLKSYITSAKAPKIFQLQRDETSGQPGGIARQWKVVARGPAAADASAGSAPAGSADGGSADAKQPLDPQGSAIPVAAVALTGSSLTFSWLPEARTTYAEALRNCVLTLRSGSAEKSLRLRRCEHADAMRVAMDKNYVLTPLPENDHSPPAESLRLELLKADDLPFGATFIPDSKTVGGADEIRIVLRTEVPAVELRARLFTSGKATSIRIAPVIADAAGKPLPFTLERLNSEKQSANKEIANAEKVSAALAQRINLIAAEVPRLRNTVVPSVTAANKIRVQIAALQAESATAAIEVSRLDKVIPEMKTRLQLFDSLFNLANQVRTATKLHFRVFFVCEEQEVDVLRAG